MTPDDPEVIDRLAAEYVLGTLRGRARRRFERWRASTPLVEARTAFWESRLMELAKGVTPVAPPTRVWEGIRVRLGFAAAPRSRRRSPLRSFAMAAGIAVALAVGTLFYWQTFGPQRPTQVAAILAASGQRVWTVEVYAKSGRLSLRAGTLPARPAGRDYELWALPKGGLPVSLGLLPGEGSAQRALTAVQQEALAAAAQVAVSIEPSGGSPTGQPTGAIVFVAPLLAST